MFFLVQYNTQNQIENIDDLRIFRGYFRNLCWNNWLFRLEYLKDVSERVEYV